MADKKTKHHSNKKWIIPLAIFFTAGIGVAIALPFFMQKPAQSIYTTEPKNKFLSDKISSTELVTKINHKNEVKTNDISYITDSPFIETTISNGLWCVRWVGLERPENTIDVSIDAKVNGNKVDTASITLLSNGPVHEITNDSGGQPHSIGLFPLVSGPSDFTVDNAINLKDISDDSNTPTFVIEGRITHTIVIPYDFSCRIYGDNGSSIDVETGNNNYGIVVGSVAPNVSESSAGITIADNNIITHSPLKNSGGIYFHNPVSSERPTIISDNQITSDANGIYFLKTISDTSVTISGNTMDINPLFTSTDSHGIYFNDDISESSVDIFSNDIYIKHTDGSSFSLSYCIYFAGNINNDNIIIKNDTMCSDGLNAYVIYFLSDISAGYIIISDNEIKTSSLYSALSYGIYFDKNIDTTSIAISNNKLLMSSSSFDIEPLCTAWGITFYGIISEQTSIIIFNNNISTSAPEDISGCSAYGICFNDEISNASITISDNTISAFSLKDSYGFYFKEGITDVRLTISENNIFASSDSETSGFSGGIYFHDSISPRSSLIISNNIIDVSSIKADWGCIYFNAGIPNILTISNNTIYSKTSAQGSNIYFTNAITEGSVIFISCNVIFVYCEENQYVGNIYFLDVISGGLITISDNVLTVYSAQSSPAAGIFFGSQMNGGVISIISNIISGYAYQIFGIMNVNETYLTVSRTNTFYYDASSSSSSSMNNGNYGDHFTNEYGTSTTLTAVEPFSWSDDLDKAFIFDTFYSSGSSQQSELKAKLGINEDNTVNVLSRNILSEINASIPA